MATRIRINPPLVIGDRTIDALVLGAMTCGHLFRAAREIADGGSQAEVKNRAAAAASGRPFAITRAVPIAVQVAIETWWTKQWQRPGPQLPTPLRAPMAGDWFDAHGEAGALAGDLEVQARVYALCANLPASHFDDLPPAVLDQVRAWYDQHAGVLVAVDEVEEAGSAAEDPSPQA